MERKDHIDTFGAAALVLFSLTLSFNQVVIKVTNDGFGPVFAAGLRSVIGIVVVVAWMRFRRIPFDRRPQIIWPGILAGLFFSLEFICLFLALDLTTVSRASIIFYSMPVWLAAVAHFTLPGERLSRGRIAGLALAMLGVGFALADRSGGEAHLIGDMLALGAALAWAAIALTVRLTPLSQARAESQLMYQLLVSALVLLSVAPLFGPLLRGPEAIHVAGLMFQAIGVASTGYLIWFVLLSIYPASSVASFSFVSPVMGVVFGWWLLGETIGPSIWLALLLVAAGLVLINRRRA